MARSSWDRGRLYWTRHLMYFRTLYLRGLENITNLVIASNLA